MQPAIKKGAANRALSTDAFHPALRASSGAANRGREAYSLGRRY